MHEARLAWPAGEQTLELDDVERLDLEKGSPRSLFRDRRTARRIALRYKDGSVVPLTDYLLGGAALHEEVAERLRQLLAQDD